MRLEVMLDRRKWTLLTAIYMTSGVIACIAFVPFLVIAIVRGDGGALSRAGICLVVVSGALPVAVASSRLARTSPAILVHDDGLELDHFGFFERPIWIRRAEVIKIGLASSSSFPTSAGGLPISVSRLPDLSVLPRRATRNLVIVLDHPMRLKGVARWWLGMLRLTLARHIGYTGITRSTVASGFTCFVFAEQEVLVALASWPLTDISDDDLLRLLRRRHGRRPSMPSGS